MFTDPEFPAITYGKTHFVELDALKKFISTREKANTIVEFANIQVVLYNSYDYESTRVRRV